MATKSCPSCAAEVPVAAPRCKSCFHDFTEAPVKKSNGPIMLLGIVAVMLGLIAVTFWLKPQMQPGAETILVDEETASIVFTTKFHDRIETDRVDFAEVANVEMLIAGKVAQYEVAVITLSGERHTVESSDDKPLNGYAEHLAALMDKPLVEKNEARGFGDLGTGGEEN
jgi:hypothetical protein